jgi:competence protein ComFC
VLCDECLLRVDKNLAPPHAWTYTLYSYKHTFIRKMIHAMKYSHRKDIAIFFGEKISKSIPEEHKDYIVVCIPMPSIRKSIRGYNHSHLIAKTVAKNNQMIFEPDILKLSKEKLFLTKRQVTTKTRKERLSNKINTFTVSKDVVQKNILIIDDVTTTGATLGEARRILLKHGAHDVIAYTIAH